MDRKQQINAMLDVASELLSKIGVEYEQSLKSRSLSPKLAVNIKNYLENLRSPLDYIASEISEEVLCLEKSHKAHFPIACENDAAFAQYIARNLPGLDSVNPALFNTLKDLQPYQQDGCKALPKLSKLVNENKHNHLSEQARTVSRGLEIKFPGGAGISMGPGTSISGGGTISSGGSWFSPAGGIVSGDRPATRGQNIQQTVMEWVSFSFTETGDEVQTLLQSCRSDVDRIVAEVTLFLWP